MFREKGKSILFGAAAALMALGYAPPAWAATAIANVRLIFDSQYDGEGGRLQEPEITAGLSGYTVSEVSWNRAVTDWTPGQSVIASVTLTPDADHSFSSIYADERITVCGAEYVSARTEIDGSLLVKASYAPVLKLGQTARAGWSDLEGKTAVWEAVPYASAYQLRLYRGDGTYVATLTLKGTSVDLSAYMAQGGDYYYEVRAVAGNGESAAFKRNGAYVTSAATSAAGDKTARWLDSPEGWRYVDENGRLADSGWRFIEGTWYYFGEDGCAVTGWQEIGGKWYYMDAGCRMQTGWLEQDGAWYYLDSTGEMVTGWYEMSPAFWYYFYEDGTMAADTVIDGYRLGSDGARIDG